MPTSISWDEMLVIRQEHIDLQETGITYNTIKYSPLGSAEFVNPNLDVAYLEAWFGVDEGSAVLLEVPEIKDRYYTAEILDEWGEVIVNINERALPSKPCGRFALVAPGSTMKVPPDTGRIELHSRKAKMLARVELKGDPDTAVALQHQFKVTTLGRPSIPPPPEIPPFSNQGLIGVEIFDDVDTKLASALDVAPNAAELQQRVRAVSAYAASGNEGRATVAGHLQKIIPKFQEFALTRSAPYRNHWIGGGTTGHYGQDFRLRTSVNFAGLWANTVAEVIYFVAVKDADERPLDGGNSYVIHFPADRLPQSVVNAYWSVILVGVPDYRVITNPLQRYNFNNHSNLKPEG